MRRILYFAVGLLTLPFATGLLAILALFALLIAIESLGRWALGIPDGDTKTDKANQEEWRPGLADLQRYRRYLDRPDAGSRE